MADYGFTTLRDLVGGFTRAVNLIDVQVQNHHEKVAYISYRLAEELHMTALEKQLAIFGALLHDIGGFMKKGLVSLSDVEARSRDVARAGAAFLHVFPGARSLSDIVGESQSSWERLRRLPDRAKTPFRLGQIVHLADAVSLLLSEDVPILNQVSSIRQCLNAADREFNPKVLAAFDRLSENEAFWMDLLYQPTLFLDLLANRPLTLDDVIQQTELMSRIIDFRSPFTAMHSAGVAETAASLAARVGMSEDECKIMRIAGNLHDVGKLKIPTEILEKPGRLTEEEFNIMKEHAYYTHLLLRGIRGFEQIAIWASLHHEKLNGNGYPFHCPEQAIPLGARIMAVADIFSAVTEDRPYRRGMEPAKVAELLRGDAQRGLISSEIVELLIRNYDAVNAKRASASAAASKKYQETLAEARED